MRKTIKILAILSWIALIVYLLFLLFEHVVHTWIESDGFRLSILFLVPATLSLVIAMPGYDSHSTRENGKETQSIEKNKDADKFCEKDKEHVDKGGSDNGTGSQICPHCKGHFTKS